MQKKVGTLLDEDLFKKAKARALSEHTTLNRVFEKALSNYLSSSAHGRRKLSMVEMSFGAVKLPRRTVQKIAQEDVYDVEST
jgi:hypothetical protein